MPRIKNPAQRTLVLASGSGLLDNMPSKWRESLKIRSVRPGLWWATLRLMTGIDWSSAQVSHPSPRILIPGPGCVVEEGFSPSPGLHRINSVALTSQIHQDGFVED